jgi:hypothetical protein
MLILYLFDSLLSPNLVYPLEHYHIERRGNGDVPSLRNEGLPLKNHILHALDKEPLNH